MNSLRSSSSLVCRIASIGALLTVAGFAAARPPEYTWRLNIVPDFDQIRGAIFDVPGLPNNGSMYCYPTAATNWMNYMASRGYPNLDPGPGFKGDVYGPVYNSMTNLIADYGDLMSTDAEGGTGVDGILDGTSAILEAAYPGDFTVQFWSCSRGQCPNYTTITNNMINGSVIILGIGWYSADEEIEDNFNRGGGHAVSLSGADDYNLPSRTWRFSDPASDDDQLFNQTSPYGTTSTAVQMQTHTFNNNITVSLPRLMAYTSAFIDGYTLITPKFGWAARPDFSGIDKLAGPLHPTHGSIPQGPQTFNSPDGTPIDEVLMHPQLDRVFVRTRGNPTTGQPGGINVCMADGSVRFVRSSVGVQGMVFSRSLELFVLEGNAISRYTEDSQGNFQRSMIRSLTMTFDTVGYDDSTDEVVCISAARRMMTRFDQDLQNAPVDEMLPPGVAPTGPISFAMWPDDTYIMADYGTGELLHIDRDSSARSREHILLARQTFPEVQHGAGGGGGAGKVAMQDIHFTKQVLVPANGFVYEYRRTATGFERVLDSRFAGIPIGGSVDFSANRTNFDPALHTGTGWENVLPTEFPPEVQNCPADVNQSGTVDFGDITTVLSQFGQALLLGDLGDADLDGDCDFADITHVLSNWGQQCD